MVKALSFDLRVRVLAAVAGGMSHRQAAECQSARKPDPISAPNIDPGLEH